LRTFATTSGECLNALREAAHHCIVKHLGLLHPRARLDVYRKAASALSGFSRANAGSAYASELFAEALLEAATAAGATELVALVEALTAEGGAAATG
jgi:hypothetical protein